MVRNPCHGWAHGDIVTKRSASGRVIATGRVSIRKSKAGRWYLQVHVGDHYEWPEGWIWGQGRLLSVCVVGCDQPYLTNDQAEAEQEFCPPCQRKEAKERAQAGSAVRNLTGYLIGAREKRQRIEKDSPEKLAAITAQKEQDAKENPFG